MTTDVGNTKRRSMTPTRRLRIFEKHNGLCVTCGIRIKAGDDWFIEHAIPLALGGKDEDDNCGPAHTACKAGKDIEDFGRIAKAKRIKQKHFGMKKPSRQQIKSAGFPKFDKPDKPHTKRMPPRSLFTKDG